MEHASSRIRAAVPQFAVADVVQTAQYFRDVLGFTIRSYWDGARATAAPGAVAVFAIVERDDVEVFFYRSMPPVPREPAGYHAYFHVRGLEALAAEWRSRGANILDGPTEMAYGQREVVVRDPNGLMLAFGERAGHGPTD